MRRLTSNLAEQVARRLDARLDAGPDTPVAVALSGGGDSLALALLAADWAKARGRPLLILTLDHGLQPQSANWTRACSATAERLGARFISLSWEGPYPSSGLPAAARRARHDRLARAARTAGARVILMGHTADDRSEAALMREAGGTTPTPREWGPSPAWPEGRGIFLLRPLLDLGRSELRRWLAARGEDWIEDPANEDPRFARSRARLQLRQTRGRAKAREEKVPETGIADLAAQVQAATFGLVLAREAFRRASSGAALRVSGAACLAAGGGSRPPRTGALAALCARLAGDGTVQATLAGAQVLAEGDRIVWGRSAGEMERRAVPDLELEAGQDGVFDGRFEIQADRPRTITRLAGRMARLGPEDRAKLSGTPPVLRGALPVVLGADGVRLAGEPGSGVRLRRLAPARLSAACGRIGSESAIPL